MISFNKHSSYELTWVHASVLEKYWRLERSTYIPKFDSRVKKSWFVYSGNVIQSFKAPEIDVLININKKIVINIITGPQRTRWQMQNAKLIVVALNKDSYDNAVLIGLVAGRVMPFDNFPFKF
jgi:hypothetical protein